MQVQSDLYSRIIGNSEFIGYTQFEVSSKLLAIVDKEDNLLDKYSDEEVVKVVFENGKILKEYTLEEVRKNLAQLKRNNLYVYKNLPERNTENIEKNSLLDEYEFNKVKQEMEKEASLNRKEEGKFKKFFKKILH